MEEKRTRRGFRSPDSRGGRRQQGGGSLLGVTEIQRLAKLEFARARRYSYPLCLAVCRIDRIDSLADLYGQKSRLLLMESLADLFRHRSRMTDLLGRLGEDRLLWLLPHTRLSEARIAADRIRLAVEGLEVSSGTKLLPITLSTGLSCYLGGDTLFFDTLLFQAQKALERAQARGGNLVEEHPLEPGDSEETGEAGEPEAGEEG